MDWLVFLSFTFVAVITPGPNNILSMANSNKFGYKKTIPFLLGVAVGFGFLVLFSGLFNKVLFEIMPKIRVVMGIIGFTYMLYLAYVLLKSLNHSNEKEEALSSASFKTGVIMQYINPKAILFAITVTGNFIVPAYDSVFMLINMSIFLGIVAYFGTSVWALMGSALNMFLSKYEKSFNIIMSLLLVYTAISILKSAFH